MPIFKDSGITQGLVEGLSADGIMGNIKSSDALPNPEDYNTEQFIGSESRKQKDWGWGTLESQQNFGRNLIGAVGESVGFPKGGLFTGALGIVTDPNPAQTLVNKFDDLDGDISSIILESDFFGKCARFGIIADAMQDAFGPALDAISGFTGVARDLVPIVGGVLNAVVSVVKFFKGMNQPEKPEAFSYKISRFYPQEDISFANNHVLNTIRSRSDWTRIWSPPGLGFGTQQFQPSFTATNIKDNNGNDWGVRIEAGDGDRRVGDEMWTGAVPLSGNIDLGWDVSKSGRGFDGTRSLGSLLPTAKDQISKLWAMAIKPGSPTSFCVDTKEARDRWVTYLIRLRIFIQDTDAMTDSAKEAFVNGRGKQYFGWADYDSSLKTEGKTSNFLFNEFGIENSHLMKSFADLEGVQDSAIDTRACAYVDSTFAAIQYDQAMRSRWENNRKRLLKHPDICRVDLDSIPDQAYRNEARIAAQNRGCGGMSIAMAPALVAGAKKPPPPPPGMNGLELEVMSIWQPGDAGDEGGGKGPLILAAMAMLGLVMVNKRR